MKQNKYDDPEFFSRYSQIPRSIGGLAEAGEWETLRALLPDLSRKRLLDLGCGFGWHCRYAREQGSASVVGVDLSERMLARARELTDDPSIEYQRTPIEEINFPAESFEVVFSSLALHYVERIVQVCQQVYRCLTPGGAFVLSVEHPIFTARAEQDWVYDEGGKRLHWPVDQYQQEGRRKTAWLAENVVKYHRTVATYLNTILDTGFHLTRVAEPQPTPQMLAERWDLQDEARRPMFLLLAAVKDSR